MITVPEKIRNFRALIAEERAWVAHTFPELQQRIMERLRSLPEESSCDYSRDSFQDGVGFAFSQFGDRPAAGAFTSSDAATAQLREKVTEAFFRLGPTGLYVDKSGAFVSEERREQFQTLVRHVRQIFVVEPLDTLEYSINEYDLEAFVAFVEGYQLVVEYFEQSPAFPRAHYHSNLV